MRVLVAHASRFGSTREIAERIGARLRSAGLETTVLPVEEADPAAFDAVVLGSGVYSGHWAPAAAALVRERAADLSSRPLWLFSSGPVGTNPAYKPTDPAEAKDARRTLNPRDHRTFCGSWDRSKAALADLSGTERFVARHLLPEGDFREWPAIEAWADGIARELLRG